MPQEKIFESQFQEKLYKRLLLLGEGPAYFYQDVCKILMGNPTLRNQTHFLSHSFREIDSSIRAVMLPIDFKLSCQEKIDGKICKGEINGEGYCSICGKEPAVRNQQIDKICEVYNLYSKLAQSWKDFQFHETAHRNSLNRPPTKERNYWYEYEIILANILEKFEEHYHDFIVKVKEIIKKKKSIASKELKLKIPNSNIIYNFIFNELNLGDDWFPTLRKNHFFDYPPEPIKHDDGGLSFPSWPALFYLEKITHKASIHNQIDEVLSKVDTENVAVQDHVVRVAIKLSSVSSNLTAAIKKYLMNRKIWFNLVTYADLVAHLVSVNKTSDSLEILALLLELVPEKRSVMGITDPQPKYHDYSYEEILTKVTPILIHAEGLGYVEFLVKTLNQGIDIKMRRKNSSSDYSYIWHSTIEEHNQNKRHGVLNDLVNNIVKSLENHIEVNADNLKEVIDYLSKQKRVVFKRIKLHLIRKHAKRGKLIAAELIDKKNFSDIELHHEYYLLAHERGIELTVKEKEKLLNLVNAGPNRSNFDKGMKARGTQPSDELFTQYTKQWQRDKLAIFITTGQEFKKRYEELAEELGEPSHPDFISYTESGSWGYKSPFTLADMKAMGHKNLVEAIEGWEPDPKNFMENYHGVSQQVTSLVEENVHDFIDNLVFYQNIKPVYQKAIISGFRTAVNAGKEIDWKKVIEYCFYVVNRCLSVYPQEVDDSEDIRWNLKNVLDFVQEGFTAAYPIPFDLRSQVWVIISKLSWFPDPDEEGEQKRLKSDTSEAFSLAINTVRGELIHAAIRYGLWVRKNDVKANLDDLTEFLDEHLDTEKEFSLAIHSAYGQYLPQLVYLGKEWLVNNLKRIFPEEVEFKKFKDAAWKAYIMIAQANILTFSLIKDQYEYAVHFFGDTNTEETHLGSPNKNLAQHLAVYYWHGAVDLAEDSLLTLFLDKMNDETRASFVSVIGHGLYDSTEVKPEVIKRMVDFWEKRSSLYEQKPSDFLKELSAYGWWFNSEKLDNTFSLRLLEFVAKNVGLIEGDHEIMETLHKLYSSDSLKVLTIIKILIENAEKQWIIDSWISEIEAILKESLKSTDQEVIELTNSIMGILTARGYSSISKLTEEST